MSVRYLLDTNICILHRQAQPARRARALRSPRGQRACDAVITLGELRFGAEKAIACNGRWRHPAARRADPTPRFARGGWRALRQIRAVLQRGGAIIGNNDLWLAAHARAEGWILVTTTLGNSPVVSAKSSRSFLHELRRCGALIEEHRPGNAAGLSSTARARTFDTIRARSYVLAVATKYAMTRTMRCAASAREGASSDGHHGWELPAFGS